MSDIKIALKCIHCDVKDAFVYQVPNLDFLLNISDMLYVTKSTSLLHFQQRNLRKICFMANSKVFTNISQL